MQPEYAPREAGKPRTLLADHIFITIPTVRSGEPNPSMREAVEAELARVATYHHLRRVRRQGVPGVERFDYMEGGRRTHTIHLITPLVAPLERGSPTRPRLAIVIDDLGYGPDQADALFRLPYPLTLSVLPNLPESGVIAEEGHRRGYQILLHLPTASTGGKKEEQVELRPGMDSEAVRRTFTTMLETVPYAVGVNNHQGSLGTADGRLMGELMPLLRERGLFFVDSRTTAATVAATAAHRAGVATTSRNVFLDDEDSHDAIQEQLALAVRDARENGSALVIGHPHPETLSVLAKTLPTIARQGVTLVFASELAR
jgi:polysaccharide deacetylase 2 family uncharacterized protein YibQ